MNKAEIVEEIKRTAASNGGAPLGWRRFEEETGVGYYDWFGRFWTKWGDAVREAGFEPNRMNEAVDDTVLLQKLVALTQSLGRVPTQGDLMMAARSDLSFPSETVFRRLGSKMKRATLVADYCKLHPGHEAVAQLWRDVKGRTNEAKPDEDESDMLGTGFVYLLKHGSRREYKIGRTNNPLRREGEIGLQLPEKLAPVHYIETDDPAGIESYWHLRFAAKRKEGEWFALTSEDVRAFKRWKRIF